MAPPVLILLARAVKKAKKVKKPKIKGGGIGGIVIAAILLIILIIFISVMVYEYRKGQRNKNLTTPPTPLPWKNIVKRAVLIALTFGLALLCCKGMLPNTDPVPVESKPPEAEIGGGYAPPPPMEPMKV